LRDCSEIPMAGRVTRAEHLQLWTEGGTSRIACQHSIASAILLPTHDLICITESSAEPVTYMTINGDRAEAPLFLQKTPGISLFAISDDDRFALGTIGKGEESRDVRVTIDCGSITRWHLDGERNPRFRAKVINCHGLAVGSIRRIGADGNRVAYSAAYADGDTINLIEDQMMKNQRTDLGKLRRVTASTAVSADGKSIAGVGESNGRVCAWFWRRSATDQEK